MDFLNPNFFFLNLFSTLVIRRIPTHCHRIFNVFNESIMYSTNHSFWYSSMLFVLFVLFVEYSTNSMAVDWIFDRPLNPRCLFLARRHDFDMNSRLSTWFQHEFNKSCWIHVEISVKIRRARKMMIGSSKKAELIRCYVPSSECLLLHRNSVITWMLVCFLDGSTAELLRCYASFDRIVLSVVTCLFFSMDQSKSFLARHRCFSRRDKEKSQRRDRVTFFLLWTNESKKVKPQQQQQQQRSPYWELWPNKQHNHISSGHCN